MNDCYRTLVGIAANDSKRWINLGNCPHLVIAGAEKLVGRKERILEIGNQIF
jgi:hypothetical protein